MVFGVRSSVISNYVQNEVTYVYALLAVVYAIIAIPLSVIIYNGVGRFNIRKHFDNYLSAATHVTKYHKNEKVFFLCMTAVSVFVVLYLSYYNAPLFMFLTGRIDRVLISRIEYSRFFQGSSVIKNVIGQSLVPLVSYITFGYYMTTKQRYWRNIFFVNLMCSIFISGAEMSKAGIAFYFIPFIFLIVILKGKIPVRNIFKYILIIGSSVVLMYSVYYASTGWSIREIILNFYGGPIGRILIGQIQSFPTFLEIFPDSHQFLFGKSIAVLRFLGLPFIESARIVAMHIEPAGVNAGWVGVANTIFLGDAYANFGLVGILISPFWLGLVYSFFYRRMLSSPKTPVLIGFYVFVLNNLTVSSTGGFFSAYVVNTRVIAAILFLLMFNLTTKIRVKGGL
jgi:oligosaccharide repeat unit polymerase